DCLFGQAEDDRPAPARPSPNFVGPNFPTPHFPETRPENAGLPPAAWPPPPALLEQSPDLRAAYDWLQAERQPLEEYTRQQFAKIQQQHQALMTQHFQREEAVALRTQELNRDIKLLAARARAVQERTDDLVNREAALAAQTEQIAQAREELLDLRQTKTAL